jgi:hypothetical protein
MRTTYRQILTAAHGVLDRIGNHYRTGRWVGTFDDFVTYDTSQTLTTRMVRELLSCIENGELDLPISLVGRDTIYVDTDAYGWLGEKL